MRQAAGYFLCLTGAAFLAPAVLALVYFILALLVWGQLDMLTDPQGLVVIGLIGFGLVFIVVMGHLMLCFANEMLQQSHPAFPSARPALWFTLRSAQLLLLAALLGSSLSIFGILLTLSQAFPLRLAAAGITATAAAIGIRKVKSTLDRIEIP